MDAGVIARSTDPPAGVSVETPGQTPDPDPDPDPVQAQVFEITPEIRGALAAEMAGDLGLPALVETLDRTVDQVTNLVAGHDAAVATLTKSSAVFWKSAVPLAVSRGKDAAIYFLVSLTLGVVSSEGVADANSEYS